MFSKVVNSHIAVISTQRQTEWCPRELSRSISSGKKWAYCSWDGKDRPHHTGQFLIRYGTKRGNKFQSSNQWWLSSKSKFWGDHHWDTPFKRHQRRIGFFPEPLFLPCVWSWALGSVWYVVGRENSSLLHGYKSKKVEPCNILSRLSWLIGCFLLSFVKMLYFMWLKMSALYGYFRKLS